jgi:hypothetical protein
MSWKNLKVRFVHIFCTTFQFVIKTWSLKRINESKRYSFLLLLLLMLLLLLLLLCTFLRKHSCTLSFQPVRLCCCCCCCSCWFTICILHFCCCSMRKNVCFYALKEEKTVKMFFFWHRKPKCFDNTLFSINCGHL